jgi:hypothetical protein
VKVTRLALLAGSVATAVVLTGCTPTGHTAIKVGSTTYSDSDVDLLTGFECSIARDPAAGVSPLSRQAARAFMATVLVSSAIDHQISVKAKAKPTSADAASTMAQLDPYIDKAAKGADRTRLRSLVESSVLGQLAVGAVVQQALGQQLTQLDQTQAQQVVSDGIKQLRADQAKKTKVQVDPVYGLSANGLEPAKQDPSLSLALSSFARSASSAQPDQSWLDALPASQKCS